MKILDGVDSYGDHAKQLISAWREVAIQLGLKTGIYIDTKIDVTPGHYIKRIYFVVDDHEFENATDLRRAIHNKAFI
jgi:hypothetical protein